MLRQECFWGYLRLDALGGSLWSVYDVKVPSEHGERKGKQARHEKTYLYCFAIKTEGVLVMPCQYGIEGVDGANNHGSETLCRDDMIFRSASLQF